MELNKNNEEELGKLKIKEKDLINTMKNCIYIMYSYEIENNLERRKK